MNIAIIGYGKMGKVIEQIATERGHHIVAKITKVNSSLLKEELQKSSPDVAIEFSVPDAAVNNILTCFELQIPVVVGTTGWYKELDLIKQKQTEFSAGILPATNFSVGVNIFLEINARLAALMKHQPDYKAEVEEIHHIHKLDAPSGTAITIAEGIIANSNYTNWYLSDEIEQNGLPIFAKRIDEVPGTHSVKYSSKIDSIEIKHEAFNRNGFALGAVLAAEFLNENRVGVYSMKDVLKIN